jgi:zinc protease
MRRWLSLFLVVPALLASQALAQAPAKTLKVPEITYETYRLPNGLQVILHRDTRLPLVGVDLWYHVGPRNERPGLTGFAHLFEHMMFEGSEHVGEKSHFKFLEGAGATNINGTTSFDRTNYFETLPSNQLELGLWLESDRMGFLLDTLDRKLLTNQRDVVRNERRQSIENQPYGLVNEAVWHELFPADHPYHARVIGSHADVEAARVEDVRQFFRQYYAPNNASLSIAGNIDIAQTKALIEKYFGPIPQGPPVPKVEATTPPITSERKITVTDTVQLPMVNLAWLTPAAFQPGDADADITGAILGGGAASRMHQELVYKQQIAQQAYCYQQSLALTSVFVCNVIARPGVTTDQIQKAADEVLTRFAQEGPTEAEVSAARLHHETDTINGLQRLGGFGGIADTLNFYSQYTGDPGYLPKDLARYEAVTPATAKAFAQKYLGQNQRVVVLGVPGKKVVDDVPRSPVDTDANAKLTPPYSAEFEAAQNWRKTPPPAGPQPTLHLPQPQQFALANGLKVYLVEAHELPVVSASFLTLAGSEADSPQKPGVAGFAADMLTEGTTHRSAPQIAEEANLLGTDVSSEGDNDEAYASINFLSNVSGKALDLLSDVALHPAFDAKEIDRVRQQRLTSLLQRKDQPTQVAFAVADKAIYGADSPYGYPSIGTESSIKGISREDLTGFWQQHSFPKDSALVLAGDLTEHEARELAEKYFGSWSGSGTAGQPPAAPAPPDRRVIFIDKPGAPQTALYAVGIGVSRSTPDYAPLQVVNTMLGGLFSSRINMNLREKHGYTYGASSRFQFERGPGPFFAGASVRSDSTAPAAQELFSELDRIRTSPLTAEELAMSKQHIIRSLPGSFETVEGTAGQMGALFVYNLPLDSYRQYPAKIEAVTTEEAAAVANKYIDPGHMILIAVGDKAKIQPGIEKLSLGPIEEWTSSAEPVKK